ncbi:MAG TPA: protein-disulfide reductase DsbD domain-containing protein [Xanthobacteraceae bacterium]|nr:protein-disulfide reductase DsbD domain-containing protein [Xanthobacteraceae bacterium]
MIASVLRQCVSTAAFGALLISAPNFAAGAEDSSSWDGDSRSAVRLVAGSSVGAGALLRAGIEIRLAAGWKTYWRYPGDSGVPPVFDFSKSENIESVTVLWPAPHRFNDEAGTSIGYKGDVIFPLHVVPANPNRPTTLRAAINYAVCEKLCIPAKGEAALELTRASSPHESQLAAAEAQTPKQSRIGKVSPFGIVAVRREPASPYPRIVVEAAAPAEAPLDLFAEGPTGDWALPLPEPVQGAPPGRRWFAFDLDGVPPGADAVGARLRFTLVSGENAIEVTTVPE